MNDRPQKREISTPETGRRGLRMAVLLDQPFWFDGANYSTNAPFINFVLSFSQRAETLLLFCPLKTSRAERGRFNVPIGDRVRIIPVPFYRTAFELYKKLPFIWRGTARCLISELEGFDVAWLEGGHVLASLASRLLRKKGKKVFSFYGSNLREEVRSHGYTGIRGWALEAVSAMVQRLSLRTARDEVVFVVGEELRVIFQKTGRSVHKVYPSVVAEGDVIKERSAGETGRVRDPGRIIFLAVGRLTPEKGLDGLVRAAELLVKSGFRRFVFRLAGDGKEKARLQGMVAGAGLEGHFEFAGFVRPGRDLMAAYDSADVLILPSLTEGIPKVLFEAMARGLPMVAANVGGVPEIVRDGENGLLVPPGEPEALARAVRRMCDEKLLREGLGKKGLETARRFTMERQRDAMYGIIMEHVAGGLGHVADGGKYA